MYLYSPFGIISIIDLVLSGYFVLPAMLMFSIIAAARIREILEHVGLVQDSLPSNVVSSSQVLANVANLLNIRDTELSRCVYSSLS